jgi:hypothetical protein
VITHDEPIKIDLRENIRLLSPIDGDPDHGFMILWASVGVDDGGGRGRVEGEVGIHRGSKGKDLKVKWILGETGCFGHFLSYPF